MKLVLSYVVLLLLLCGCKKDTPGTVDFSLTGRWVYKQHGLSIGGPVIWTDATPANQLIEFGENNRFIPASNFLSSATRYEKLDSVTLQFTPVSSATGIVKMGFAIDSTTGKLSLWPVDPYCIEGCGYVFVRKNDK